MSWFRPKKSKGLRAGIGIHDDGLSVAVATVGGKSLPQIVHCEFVPAKGDEQEGALERLVRDNRLRNAPVVVVLEPGSYSLLQVEAPQVEPEELRSAIRWRIKDLIDFHIDDAVLDIFDMPIPERKGVPRFMYVVAARMGQIQQLVDRLTAVGVDLTRIDITELALKNVLARVNGGEDAQALLCLSKYYGMIEVVRDSTLYLIRRIEINGLDLEEQGGFGLDELLDSLSLELQRSLDYHESQFGIGQVAGVSIVAPQSRGGMLQEILSENLNSPVSLLKLNSNFKHLEEFDPDQVNLCLPAIGAVLGSC